MKQHILVIDDEPDIRETVRDILEDEGYLVSVAENAEDGRRQLRERLPDLVLLGIWMPDVDGITLLKEWKEVSGGELPSPVVMMSGHGSVETAVEATRLGAYDFLEKPLSIPKLLLTVERAVENSQLAWREVIATAVRHGVPVPAFSSAGAPSASSIRYSASAPLRFLIFTRIWLVIVPW